MTTLIGRVGTPPYVKTKERSSTSLFVTSLFFALLAALRFRRLAFLLLLGFFRFALTSPVPGRGAMVRSIKPRTLENDSSGGDDFLQ